VEARLAVLASGSGTNLQALLDDPVVGQWIALVVSDRERALALERARVRGVRTEFLDPALYPDRAAYGRALVHLLQREAIDHVVLAGFMRILDADLVRAYEGRLLNIHPSLLPAFPGRHAVRDALAWGAKVSGVTIHLVDEKVDHGPIVIQEAVPVLEDDDEGSLHARIREVEHRQYPRAVRMLVEGRIKLEGRRVHVVGEFEAAR
jgi:phosphoribosylglycinamide formyltransferase 1